MKMEGSSDLSKHHSEIRASKSDAEQSFPDLNVFPERFVKLMKLNMEIDKEGLEDQIKYVKKKIKQNKKTGWSDLGGLKNIPDETKEKILGSYKKITVKPYRQEKEVVLEDVETE